MCQKINKNLKDLLQVIILVVHFSMLHMGRFYFNKCYD
jgi:hypothetical protein